MPEVKIHLELSLPLKPLTVNAVIALFQQVLTQLVPQLVAAWLAAWQDHELERLLGPSWSREPQKAVPWACPDCQSQMGFHRRGSRGRVLRKTSLGRLAFQLRQVTCQRCGATFAPFAEQLDLTPYQVSTTEFRARAAEAVCQVSYQRGARMVSQAPLVASISATAVHTWVQQEGAKVTFDAEEAEGRSLLLDGTKVKAGRKERGAPLHLGMALSGRTTHRGRAQLVKHVVAVGVDEDWATTLDPLADITPERVVFDGDPDLAAVIAALWSHTYRQRCLWHLPHQLYYALWADGLRKAESEPIQMRLIALLYESPNLEQAQAAYQALSDELRLEGLDRGASYLCQAQADVFTFREHPHGLFADRSWFHASQALLATSPLEREMREINRRTDNGSRWSVPGVRNLVGLDLVRRYDPQQWDRLWQLPEPSSASDFVLKAHAEMVSPRLNVKTT
jgi:hypothetical protein